MQTNYQQLSSLDAAMIVVAFAGVGLISLIVYSGLPEQAQANLSYAVSVFDMNEQAVEQANTLNLVFSTSQDFLDEFYLAFTEVAALPNSVTDVLIELPKDVAGAYDDFALYADSVAMNYQMINVPQFSHMGEVAGASIDLSFIQGFDEPEFSSEVLINDLNIPYRFTAPDLKWLDLELASLKL